MPHPTPRPRQRHSGNHPESQAPAWQLRHLALLLRFLGQKTGGIHGFYGLKHILHIDPHLARLRGVEVDVLHA
ncbi:MAG: hypothetical protein ACQKBY_10800, partial [Verrucomicrobiales bacterium]